MITCPHCKGCGILYAAFHPIALPCTLCKTTGKIGAAEMDWVERGRQRRSERLERRETTPDYARRVGLDCVTVSDAERGIIDPSILP
jgi:hypothetical protein